MSKSLFNLFDNVSVKAWKQKIQSDLKGADDQNEDVKRVAEFVTYITAHLIDVRLEGAGRFANLKSSCLRLKHNYAHRWSLKKVLVGLKDDFFDLVHSRRTISKHLMFLINKIIILTIN